MTDWRQRLAELDRTAPDREAIRRRLDGGRRFADPIAVRREPRIAVIAVATAVAIVGVGLVFFAFRNDSGLTRPASAGTSSASAIASGAPCPVTDSPALGEADVGFNTECLAIVANRPATITGKSGVVGEHALLVCSDKDCNQASRIAETDVAKGPSGFVLKLPALEAGTYFFQDPIDPATANGTLYVIQGS